MNSIVPSPTSPLNVASSIFPVGEPVRTKLICTIGPATSSKEMLTKLVEAGMDVCRLNLTHCSHEFASQVIKNLREIVKARGESGTSIGVMVDLNGWKIRSGKLKEGKPVYLEKGQEFYLVNDENLIGDKTQIGVSYTKRILEKGDFAYIDDGLIELEAVERIDAEHKVKCIVKNPGWLGENKGINFPAHILQDAPSLTPADFEHLKFAINHEVDMVALSCVRSVEDVEELRMKVGNSNIKVIAKIENRSGMDNFKNILKVSDGIMIDRGYLGVEVEVELVATAQKRMIALANMSAKPVMVSNQMLESMRYYPRPTRAEAADTANAVLDGVDALVLSAETAIGDYPLESLKMMRRIAKRAEEGFDYIEFQQKTMKSTPKPLNVSESIASSAVACARQIGAACIIVTTEVGGTARLIAKYRTSQSVIATTYAKRTARQLAISFGLVPLYHDGPAETLISNSMKFAVEMGLANPGDVVVITSGQVVGFLDGSTTRMQVATIPERFD